MERLLIVVDFQNDFVNGTLGFDKAPDIENAIVEKIKTYRKSKNKVVFTFDTHNENYLETIEGKHLPIKHCIKQTKGWQLYGNVAKELLETDKVFYKDTFGSVELFDYLRQNKYSEIELVGLVSNICVISNAILAKTAQPETEIFVDTHATASFDDDLNTKTFDILKGLHVNLI